MLTGSVYSGLSLYELYDMDLTPTARANSIISGSVRIQLHGAHADQR